jgi:hypothetical protein
VIITSRFLPTQLLESRRLGVPGGGSLRSRSRIVLGSPGRCPHTPVLTTMLFDNSGSVSTGNDPIGNRYDEAKLAVEAIARRCRCQRELAAIVHFDYPTSRCVAPTPLDRLGLRTIHAGLGIPTDSRGISELGPSLKRAYKLAAEHPDYRHVLVIASDFELFDPDVPKVLEDVRSFPGQVFAVVLRSEPPQILVDDEKVAVVRIGYDDEAGAVARAIFESLTVYRHS